ncbi:PTS transporter subunit IIABC [Lactobacillus gasseri]|uniref:PTS transporter subunit IIABC n=1 Tax=Lactobacillus gasseri TaxID=1596 RepID=UPI001F57F191|nr:PTS transporter subunit IIABC [Lactobacillus gasseri]UNL43826.1 PTS transporter subunit EIIC [Lactobacillus gasseri]
MFKKFSQLGQAFMLPIAILPAAGLLLGLGGALSNDVAVKTYPWLGMPWLQTILKVMNFAGNAVFANLALIFSIGLAVGLANGDKGTAGLAGGVAYLVYTGTISGLLQLFRPKTTIDTGVLGAIVLGGTVAYLHNHFRKTELPQFLGFFGGSRFIPIISSAAAIIIGVIFFLIWPPILNALTEAGRQMARMGAFGTFLYGFLCRLLNVVGLHHAIYPMFWYTALGGTAKVAGHTVIGAQNIFFAQLGDPNFHGLFTYGTRFFAGRFVTMIFGLPGAALAMYLCLPKKNRKNDGSIYLSGGLTSFVTGITEPIEYTFAFVAPWLYVIHAFLDGVSYYLADILNIRIGCSFSGGIIDFILFGVLQGKDKTNWPFVIFIGIIWFFLYFFVFTFCIKKFHIAIPGMTNDDDDNDTENINISHTGDKLYDDSLTIINALGGQDNIETVSACATRLRVAVKDAKKVNKKTLMHLGAAAVVEVSDGIQAIFGGKADLYSQEINDIITHPDMQPVSNPQVDKINKSTSTKVETVHKSEKVIFKAPVKGKFEDITQVKDEVFSQKMMGEGFAIEPENGKIYSPVDATVISIFKTKHAIGLKTKSGLEVMLHLGIDTVELQGKPFTMKVKEGDQVTPETQLIEMDLEQVKDAGKDPVVMTLITNSNDRVSQVEDIVTSGQLVEAHDDVYSALTK